MLGFNMMQMQSSLYTVDSYSQLSSDWVALLINTRGVQVHTTVDYQLTRTFKNNQQSQLYTCISLFINGMYYSCENL